MPLSKDEVVSTASYVTPAPLSFLPLTIIGIDVEEVESCSMIGLGRGESKPVGGSAGFEGISLSDFLLPTILADTSVGYNAVTF